MSYIRLREGRECVICKIPLMTFAVGKEFQKGGRARVGVTVEWCRRDRDGCWTLLMMRRTLALIISIISKRRWWMGLGFGNEVSRKVVDQLFKLAHP